MPHSTKVQFNTIIQYLPTVTSAASPFLLAECNKSPQVFFNFLFQYFGSYLHQKGFVFIHEITRQKHVKK